MYYYIHFITYFLLLDILLNMLKEGTIGSQFSCKCRILISCLVSERFPVPKSVKEDTRRNSISTLCVKSQ